MPGPWSSNLIGAYYGNTPKPLGIKEIPWYVIHTCCHHEARVEERLRQKGLEVFLPRYLTASRRRDRKKILRVPLFPGYLFIRNAFDTPVYNEILKFPRVVRVLANSTGLLPLPAETIESIKLAVAGNRPHYPYPFLQKGKRVLVVEGPLAGVIGFILEAKKEKRKVVIEVEMFRRALAVELEDEAVELCR
jgi:transcription antitermination factor NusG